MFARRVEQTYLPAQRGTSRNRLWRGGTFAPKISARASLSGERHVDHFA
jgi:hypothetical protein